jgi:hypothetical protein
MMGSPLVRSKEKPPIDANWPVSVKETLQKIRSHPSKASGSYYYKTFWDYFSDCEKSLSDMQRYLKPNSFAFILVQGSYYKEIYVDLPKIYSEFGNKIGFDSEIIAFYDVKHHLTQINTRSNAHRESTNYSEALVALKKR